MIVTTVRVDIKTVHDIVDGHKRQCPRYDVVDGIMIVI